MATTDFSKCPECGEAWVRSSGVSMTLVGYGSPPGHDHDDNCRTQVFECANGHRRALSRRNACPVAGCDWKGKTTCFCREGEKVDEWPGSQRGEPKTVSEFLSGKW